MLKNFSWLFPHRCVCCLGRLNGFSRPQARISSACLRCQPPILVAHHPLIGFDQLITTMPFTAEAAFLIKHAKYTPNVRLLRELGELLAELADPQIKLRPTQILAAPSHPKLLARRGINPARLLAQALARRCGVPLLEPFTREVGRGPQASLTRAVRARTGARQLGCKGAIGPRVLIVDDVLTTGATLGALANLARRNGAESVAGIALCDASGR